MTIDAPLAPLRTGAAGRGRWRRHLGTPSRAGRTATETGEAPDAGERWSDDQDVREFGGLALLALVAMGVMLLLPSAVDVALTSPAVAAAALVLLAIGAWAWRRRGGRSATTA